MQLAYSSKTFLRQCKPSLKCRYGMNWFNCFKFITGLWFPFFFRARNNVLRNWSFCWSVKFVTPLLNKSSTSFPSWLILSVNFLCWKRIGKDLRKGFNNIVIVYLGTISKISWSLVNIFHILLKDFKRPASGTFGILNIKNRYFTKGWASWNFSSGTSSG